MVNQLWMNEVEKHCGLNQQHFDGDSRSFAGKYSMQQEYVDALALPDNPWSAEDAAHLLTRTSPPKRLILMLGDGECCSEFLKTSRWPYPVVNGDTLAKSLAIDHDSEIYRTIMQSVVATLLEHSSRVVLIDSNAASFCLEGERMRWRSPQVVRSFVLLNFWQYCHTPLTLAEMDGSATAADPRDCDEIICYDDSNSSKFVRFRYADCELLCNSDRDADLVQLAKSIANARIVAFERGIDTSAD
jgi:hypothetical protein